MYPFGRRNDTLSRKARDILILMVCVLALLNALQFILHRSTATNDSSLRAQYISQARSEIESARTAASQLLRTGGSNTLKLLAQTRQHVYAINQLNDLSNTLRGGRLVAEDPLDLTFRALDACEERLLAGLAIDTPLADLHAQLEAIYTQIASLAN